MNKRRDGRILLLVMLLLIVVLVVAGCTLNRVQVGDLKTETEAVEAGGATSADVTVTMGVGRLAIDGGAANLMDAEFRYNVDSWKPEVSYSVDDGNGRLQVRQPETSLSGIPESNIDYAWTLEFNDAIPLDVDLNLGAGESELDFSSLTLSSLAIETGAGQTAVEIGEQTMDNLTVEAGLGDVSIVTGGGAIDNLRINTGAGQTTVDLRGDWTADMSAAIEGGLGTMTILLPSNVGVRVQAETGLGNLNTTGLQRDGESYVNDAYGDSDVTLTLTVNSGVGEVNLEVR